MDKSYSVLMSVYQKEHPEYLYVALKSMAGQSMKPLEIVLVCDGPLTKELDAVLEKTEFQDVLKVIRLAENVGLGAALSKGLPECTCEWVARMDSDDIAASDRCEKQMAYLQAHPEVDVLSGTIEEFQGNAGTEREARNFVLSIKTVPRTQEEVSSYIKMRNPVNHPCVMFRKSKVLAAGGYQPCPLFEDYDLWVRMYQNGCRFANLPDTLLYMRVNDMHRRRGGISYIKPLIHFWTGMYRRRMLSFPQYIFVLLSRILVSLLPNGMRKMIYDKKLRNHNCNER